MVIRDRLLRAVDLGDGQAVDVVAAPGKQPDDARQDARLVVDQHGDRVALGGVARYRRSAAIHTSTMPSSETGCFASSSGPSSISLWAAPEGIIGKQFSALIDRDVEHDRARRLEHLADRVVELGRVARRAARRRRRRRPA